MFESPTSILAIQEHGVGDKVRAGLSDGRHALGHCSATALQAAATQR